MDNQNQEDAGAGARKKGQRNARRRKNVPGITSDRTTAAVIKNSLESGNVDQTINSSKKLNEDGTVDLLKNLIGWPECGSYDDGIGNDDADDGTVDLITSLMRPPPQTTAGGNGREENDDGTVTISLMGPSGTTGIDGERNNVGLIKSLVGPALGNRARNDGGIVGLSKPLTGRPPETTAGSSGARNEDGTVDLLKSLMGAPPDTSGERNEDGTLDLISSLMGPPPPPQTAGSSRREGYDEDRMVEMRKSLMMRYNNYLANNSSKVVETVGSKKRKQVGESSGGQTTRSPLRQVFHICMFCKTAWFRSTELLAQHKTSCPNKPVHH